MKKASPRRLHGEKRREEATSIDGSARARDLAFASLVLELLPGAKLGQPVAAEHSSDVRSVVYGLAFLQQITLSYFKSATIEEKRSSGALQALDILDALEKGVQHPIFNFVAGLKSNQRRNRPPASNLVQIFRGVVVGTAIAYQKVAHCDETAAQRAVAEHFTSKGVAINRDDFKNWKKRASDQFHQVMANELLERYGTSADTVLQHGLNLALLNTEPPS
ncbi:MAG TPA: hypothetical protein VII20_22000 [Roseiarcus sp.]|jgi:hypothetical protein